MDHEMTEHNNVGIAGNGSALSRQVTVALTPEQYERLFFQPNAPRRGDLAKRFGKCSFETRSSTVPAGGPQDSHHQQRTQLCSDWLDFWCHIPPLS